MFGGFLFVWQYLNIRHHCYLTVLLYSKALISQLIILLIGALRKKSKLWFWQHSELEATEIAHLCVLALMPPGSSWHSDSSQCRALPNPLVCRNRASTPSVSW